MVRFRLPSRRAISVASAFGRRVHPEVKTGTPPAVDTDMVDEPGAHQLDGIEDCDGVTGSKGGKRSFSAAQDSRRRIRSGLAAALGLLVVTGSLAGWTGYTALQKRNQEQTDLAFVEVARQGALNLANIDAADVQTDVQRIIDSSTGSFLQDFQQRSQGFAEFVVKAKSKSEATIREAGLESRDTHQARVLVALSVKVSAPDAPPEPQPRAWRIRITVDRVDGNPMKISNVEFIP